MTIHFGHLTKLSELFSTVVRDTALDVYALSTDLTKLSDFEEISQEPVTNDTILF
jgi:hypothetical protein